MGFVLNSVHRLVFDELLDEDGQPLEVRVKPLTFAEWAELDGGGMTVQAAVQLFIDHLVSWNLENGDDDGNTTPVPATAEGVKSQDAMFVNGLVGKWARKVVEVSRPLERPSTSGQPSLEASIPMEALSPNPESLPTPS